MKPTMYLPGALLVAVTLLDAHEAGACGAIFPTPGWTVTDSEASANGLPTDAPIPLGLSFARDYGSVNSRGTVRVRVSTLDGVEVEGTFEPSDVEPGVSRFDSFFRPRASLAPMTRYRVTTSIENGTVLKGPAVRTFELTTTAGPLRPTVPADLTVRAGLTWQSFPGEESACCDGATPRNHDSCGDWQTGHCFSTAGAPRMAVLVSWSPLAAAEMPFLSFALVDPSGPIDGYREGLRNGSTSAGVRFTEEAERYCVTLEVTNRAVPGRGSVKSAPICLDHGSRSSFASFVPDLSAETSTCTGPITRFDASGVATNEPFLAAKAPAADGGCSTTAQGTSGLELVAIAAVALSARGRRRRRSSPCS